MTLNSPEALPPSMVERWLAEARAGSVAALGRLLETYRPYLLAVANADLAPELRARADPDDVVQETLLEGACGFAAFRGASAGELLAWLRSILNHNLANERCRHVETTARSVRREVALAALPSLRDPLGEGAHAPSGPMQRREREAALGRALGRLSKDHRQVLLLHTCDGLSFAAAGARMGRSAEATRKLWGRAAEALARLLGDEPP